MENTQTKKEKEINKYSLEKDLIRITWQIIAICLFALILVLLQGCAVPALVGL